MKTRYIWVLFGLAFFVTLAVIVGQRLSSEAMAVMVGVVAGVAASIPTSLIVVWLATRTALSRPVLEVPVPRPSPPAEPRIVVMAPNAASGPAGYQNFAGYAPAAPAGPPASLPAAYAAQMDPYSAQAGLDPRAAAFGPLPARHFTMIGGAEVWMDEPESQAEVVWPR